MAKLRGVLFLWKCCFYCTWRIIRGYTWNSIAVNLEYPEGKRKMLTYIRLTEGYRFQEYP